VRLICRKGKNGEQLAKQDKKHQHGFLGAITFDQSQEGCAEVFTSFALISYLSTTKKVLKIVIYIFCYTCRNFGH